MSLLACDLAAYVAPLDLAAYVAPFAPHHRVNGGLHRVRSDATTAVDCCLACHVERCNVWSFLADKCAIYSGNDGPSPR